MGTHKYTGFYNTWVSTAYLLHVTGAAHILPVKKHCSVCLHAHEAECEWNFKDFLKKGEA